MAQSHRVGSSFTGALDRRSTSQSSQPATASRSKECEGPRCQVMRLTASAPERVIGITSRSGKVPSTPPATRAARRWRAGAINAVTALPRAICVKESIGLVYPTIMGRLRILVIARICEGISRGVRNLCSAVRRTLHGHLNADSRCAPQKRGTMVSRARRRHRKPCRSE